MKAKLQNKGFSFVLCFFANKYMEFVCCTKNFQKNFKKPLEVFIGGHAKIYKNMSKKILTKGC